MPFVNPGGHNWGRMNLDGWGITQIVLGVVYSVFFYAACGYVWMQRKHPVLKMRKVGLALSSVLILHVYLFMVFMVYAINGAFPCNVEFWSMSIYLPIGIGLFQAQNQQLLIVSREQNYLLHTEEHYKPLYPAHGKGIGGPKYWVWRLKLWWQGISTQGKYEGFVVIGIMVQFIMSLIIYCISRKFSSHGIVSHHASPAMCRRGWEWAPSIIWQCAWTYLFGPYLLWKIRMINDIYHWRLQTTLAVVAGIPGTPLWLAGVYSDSFGNINKYFVPAMWFVPGLVTMELVTLVFPIVRIIKHKKAVRATEQALADFDMKKLGSESARSGSLITDTTSTKRGKMYSMESLDECLAKNHDGLQVYASCMELNGENIIFLTKVLSFKKQWHAVLSRSYGFSKAVKTMYRAALSIYIQLVHVDTASYPINIESPIYAKLEAIFGAATTLMASRRRGSEASSAISVITPWDSETPGETPGDHAKADEFPMHAMPARPTSSGNDSSEHIMSAMDPDNPLDPLANFIVPDTFDEHVFDAAYKSIKYMVWTETWQRYQGWKGATLPNA